jgi:hypothetical protein
VAAFYIYEHNIKDKNEKKTNILHCRNGSNIQYQNRRKEKSISLAQIYDRSLPWLGTDTSIKSGGVKLIVWAHTSPL